MESLEQKLDKLTGDVTQIAELYEFAEKVYSYENLRQPRQVFHFLSFSYKYNSLMKTKKEEM